MPERSADENGRDGSPRDWGDIVVPDDASELADLAEQVRRERRRHRRAASRQRRTPFLILAIAVVVTLASLVAALFLGQAGQDDRESPPPSPGTSQSTD